MSFLIQYHTCPVGDTVGYIYQLELYTVVLSTAVSTVSLIPVLLLSPITSIVNMVVENPVTCSDVMYHEMDRR